MRRKINVIDKKKEILQGLKMTFINVLFFLKSYTLPFFIKIYLIKIIPNKKLSIRNLLIESFLLKK